MKTEIKKSLRDPLGERVKSTIRKYSLFRKGDSVLIGLSGGPDSVFLTYMLHRLRDELGLALYAAYVNHNLRPDEVPNEIRFCEALCQKLAIGFRVEDGDLKSYPTGNGVNTQEAARELRYTALVAAAHGFKAERIAVGHNADDQIETFLMRLLRGSGPKGLAGMPAARGMIIRPLIEIERREIESFLHENGISYVTDSSNLSTDYFRNKLRSSLVPLLRQFNPNIRNTLLNTMSIFREEERFFEVAVTKSLMKLISRKRAGRIELFLTPLEALETILLRRVLRRAIDETEGLRGIGFAHIEEIIGLIKKGDSGDRIYLPKGLRVIRDYSLLVMTSEPPEKVSLHELGVPGECVLPEVGAVLRAGVEQKADFQGHEKTSVSLDMDLIKAPLIVRSRRPGDFFFPLGFGKRKKLQDFFVDEKVPRDERDAVPIVCSGQDIVWISGYRADERFRVSQNTTKFVKIELLKGKS